MKQAVAAIWNNWYFQDTLVFVLTLTLAVLVRNLSRREYWQSAFHRVFRRRLIRVSFAVLGLYVLIALLDSVGFHPPLRTADGSPRRHTETNQIVYDSTGLSLLDVLCTPIRTTREKTYSAPFARFLLTKETVVDSEGIIRRESPPLNYPRRHVLGTDRVGNDVLFLALKGVRTGMIIGAFTTLIVIPFAIFFGMVSGYFGGWLDDLIQYVYTVLASIPSILLIAAFMVIAGQGLPQLCIIMGITSWTGLCRVLRGETLKLRETEYVQAAEAMGVSRPRILMRHILPNLAHVVLITAVLSFSGRVLAEAVLTYIGIGVGTGTISWGVMINDSLRELARDPMIWWNLTAALIFMLGLVLPANLFGDALRDALDPRLKTE